LIVGAAAVVGVLVNIDDAEIFPSVGGKLGEATGGGGKKGAPRKGVRGGHELLSLSRRRKGPEPEDLDSDPRQAIRRFATNAPI
jgi:hypothetical protein